MHNFLCPTFAISLCQTTVWENLSSPSLLTTHDGACDLALTWFLTYSRRVREILTFHRTELGSRLTSWSVNPGPEGRNKFRHSVSFLLETRLQQTHHSARPFTSLHTISPHSHCQWATVRCLCALLLLTHHYYFCPCSLTCLSVLYTQKYLKSNLLKLNWNHQMGLVELAPRQATFPFSEFLSILSSHWICSFLVCSKVQFKIAIVEFTNLSKWKMTQSGRFGEWKLLNFKFGKLAIAERQLKHATTNELIKKNILYLTAHWGEKGEM